MRQLPQSFTARNLLIFTFLLMFSVNYGKWGDPLIDFGREVYIPWALTQGKTLFTDIAYFNGPFSPYFNALVYSLLGAGLDRLFLVNTAIAAGIAWLIFRLLSVAASRAAAVYGVLAYITLFAFSQYSVIGNYNYVSPYSHEATHGLALALGMLVCLTTSFQTSRRWPALVAGICCGCVMLTKPEITLAAGATAGAAFFAMSLTHSLKQSCRQGALFLVGVLAPLLAAYALSLQGAPAREALQGVLGGWVHVGAEGLKNNPFYQSIIGVDNLSHDLTKMLTSFMGLLAVLWSLSVIAGSKTFNKSRRFVIFLPAVLLAAGVWVFQLPLIPAFSRSFPLALLLAFVFFTRTLLKERSTQSAISFIFCVFSGALLLKIVFKTHIYHYGFFLALPASMFMICLVFTWAPKTLRALSSDAAQRSYTTGMGAVLAVVIVWHLLLSFALYGEKNVIVGKGSDAFAADIRGVFVNLAVDWLQTNTDTDATVLVLPEGAMINYQARRINPTKIINLLPPEVMMFTEGALLQSIRENAPEYILLMHRDTSNYGVRFFGRDYGQGIMDWIATHYHEVHQIGSRPFKNNAFGLLVLQKNINTPMK